MGLSPALLLGSLLLLVFSPAAIANSISPHGRSVEVGKRSIEDHSIIEQSENPLEEKPIFRSNSRSRRNRRFSRIIGGEKALPSVHPWIATLQLRYPVGNYRAGHFCGGTLIRECWILTAAHCVAPLCQPDVWKVLLGKTDLKKREASEQMFVVEKIIIHESYREGISSVHYDIALMKLRQVRGRCARESSFVKTMSLPDLEFPTGEECTVAGWGVTETASLTPNLMEASVQVISEADCSKRKSYGNLIDWSMLCAGVPEGGVDSCQGDSGGPLICDGNGVPRVAGVVSWGHRCGVKNKPGVYAHVYRFVPWIKKMIDANP